MYVGMRLHRNHSIDTMLPHGHSRTPAARSSQPAVSERLLPALEGLAAALGRLALHLDAVAFRETWRAIAVAANRLLYNDVATEARFSGAGAAAFAADCDALVS